MSVRWDLRVPDSLAEAVDALAESRGQTRTRVVVTALAAALDRLDADLSSRSVVPRVSEDGSREPSASNARSGMASPSRSPVVRPEVPRRAPFNTGPKPFTGPRPKP